MNFMQKKEIEGGISVVIRTKNEERWIGHTIQSVLGFLYKPEIASQDIEIDWIGFNIDDQYVVGYGLDLKQIYRGLPGIYKVNNEI